MVNDLNGSEHSEDSSEACSRYLAVVALLCSLLFLASQCLWAAAVARSSSRVQLCAVLFLPILPVAGLLLVVLESTLSAWNRAVAAYALAHVVLNDWILFGVVPLLNLDA